MAEGIEVDAKPPHDGPRAAPYINQTLFITEAGVKLRLSEVAMASALQFYHIFQRTAGKEEYDEKLVAMAALNLASKIQEIPLKLSDVVNTCYRCLHRDKPALDVGDLYWKLKDSVARYELVLLRALRFKMHLDLPHRYLVHHLLALSRWVAEEQWEKSHIVLTAWALVQDSFHTTLNLDHPANKMAVAVLYLAVHCCKLTVPSDGAGRQWWTVMCPGTKETQLQAIAEQIMALYEVEQLANPTPGHLVSSSLSDRTLEPSGCREVDKCAASQDPDCIVIE